MTGAALVRVVGHTRRRAGVRWSRFTVHNEAHWHEGYAPRARRAWLEEFVNLGEYDIAQRAPRAKFEGRRRGLIFSRVDPARLRPNARLWLYDDGQLYWSFLIKVEPRPNDARDGDGNWHGAGRQLRLSDGRPANKAVAKIDPDGVVLDPDGVARRWRNGHRFLLPGARRFVLLGSSRSAT